MLFIKRGAFLLKMFGGSEFGEVKHTKSFPLKPEYFIVFICSNSRGEPLFVFQQLYVFFVKERNCLKKGINECTKRSVPCLMSVTRKSSNVSKLVLY